MYQYTRHLKIYVCDPSLLSYSLKYTMAYSISLLGCQIDISNVTWPKQNSWFLSHPEPLPLPSTFSAKWHQHRCSCSNQELESPLSPVFFSTPNIQFKSKSCWPEFLSVSYILPHGSISCAYHPSLSHNKAEINIFEQCSMIT